jgi:hypothetical protein
MAEQGTDAGTRGAGRYQGIRAPNGNEHAVAGLTVHMATGSKATLGRGWPWRRGS